MAKKRKPGEGGSVRDAFAFDPLVLDINYVQNCSRACLYSTPKVLQAEFGSLCPYTLKEIEQRLASFIRHGQITPISVYLTATGVGVVVDGFLRATAFVYAALVEPTPALLERLSSYGAKVKLKKGQTLLDKIMGARGRVLCTGVTAPKNSADYLALAERNFEENAARKELTPVDTAFYVRRLTQPLTEGGFGLTRPEAAAKLGVKVRSLSRYFQLLSLEPQVIASVHEGIVSMSAAIKKGSQQGKGSSKGPHAGLKHANMRIAFQRIDEREPPTAQLDTGQVLRLLKRVAGVEEPEDVASDDAVEAWATWLNAAKKKKKAPPKKVPN